MTHSIHGQCHCSNITVYANFHQQLPASLREPEIASFAESMARPIFRMPLPRFPFIASPSPIRNTIDRAVAQSNSFYAAAGEC